MRIWQKLEVYWHFIWYERLFVIV